MLIEAAWKNYSVNRKQDTWTQIEKKLAQTNKPCHA